MTVRVVGRPPRRAPAWSWPSNYDLAVFLFGSCVVFLQSFPGPKRETTRNRTPRQLTPASHHSRNGIYSMLELRCHHAKAAFSGR